MGAVISQALGLLATNPLVEAEHSLDNCTKYVCNACESDCDSGCCKCRIVTHEIDVSSDGSED